MKRSGARVFAAWVLRSLGPVSLVILATGCSVFTRHAHEYASLEERSLAFHDRTFPLWNREEEAASLRQLSQEPEPGARLVWVVYFSPWCPNWRYQSSSVERLHSAYRESGLRVIGVSEYGTRHELERFFGGKKPSYPVMIESEKRENRAETSHYHYRQQTGDSRKWGSPWNVFFRSPNSSPTNDILTEQVWVANGEVIEAEVERLIQGQLRVEP